MEDSVSGVSQSTFPDMIVPNHPGSTGTIIFQLKRCHVDGPKLTLIILRRYVHHYSNTSDHSLISYSRTHETSARASRQCLRHEPSYRDTWSDVFRSLLAVFMAHPASRRHGPTTSSATPTPVEDGRRSPKQHLVRQPLLRLCFTRHFLAFSFEFGLRSFWGIRRPEPSRRHCG